MEIIYSLEEIDVVSKKIVAENLQKIVIFNAEMGVGKTTFIKSLVANLGAKNVVSSPTFSLVNEYQIKENQYVYHFDFYRLKDEVEALDFGVEEYFYSGNRCFIEWAEKIPNLLPQKHSIITLQLLPDGKRKLIATF